MATEPPQRQPQNAAPRRIEPLATLPVFYKLKGRKVVVAGESEGAVWKAELLASAGAHVAVFAGERVDLYQALSAWPDVSLHARHWQEADLAGATIAIAEAEDEEEARRFVAAAKAAGAAVNVIDKPAFCEFQFGSLVNRSPLIIAISTDGAIPVLAQALRAKIEALVPAGITRWVEASKSWRGFVKALDLPFAARRTFWERIAAKALAEPDRMPQDADREAAAQGLTGGETVQKGRVFLVGAGPGDPELLTLRAVRALQSADVILYDDLVSSSVLDMARREAKRIGVGKRGGGPSCRQDDINALMVSLASEGKTVVRLKSGDPAIFGRAGEEIAVCQAAGLSVELVPGISAAQGAAAALTASLTHRDHARRLQFMTGHAANGQLPVDINWAAIADKAATTVIYMPQKTLAAFRDKALAAGLDGATTAIAMASVSTDQQDMVRATIATLPEALQAHPLSGPVLVLIGEALSGNAEDAQP